MRGPPEPFPMECLQSLQSLVVRRSHKGTIKPKQDLADAIDPLDSTPGTCAILSSVQNGHHLDTGWTDRHDKETGQEAKDQWKYHLRADLGRPLFCSLHPLVSPLI